MEATPPSAYQLQVWSTMGTWAMPSVDLVCSSQTQTSQKVGKWTCCLQTVQTGSQVGSGSVETQRELKDSSPFLIYHGAPPTCVEN